MNFPMVRELSRKKNAIKILKYLMKCKEEQRHKDVYTALDMNDCTVLYWLKRLRTFGLVKGVRSMANLKSTYYSIGDKEGAEWVIERYHWNIGFKLARLIPYEKIEEGKVRKDKRFLSLCEEYYLTIDEGIEAVKKCPKIGVEKPTYNPYNKTYLYRKEQGYDEPEKTPEQILEEARRAIG